MSSTEVLTCWELAPFMKRGTHPTRSIDCQYYPTEGHPHDHLMVVGKIKHKNIDPGVLYAENKALEKIVELSDMSDLTISDKK